MLATSPSMISRKASASAVPARRQLAAISTVRPSAVVAKAGLFDFFKAKEEEIEEVVAPVKKAGGPFAFLNKEAKKAAPKAKAAIKKAAPSPPSGTSLSSVLSFLPFGGAEAPSPAPVKKAIAKKAAAKPTPVIRRKVQPYVYDGSGVEPDRDFSTVESRRNGKMRPANLDMSTARSYW